MRNKKRPWVRRPWPLGFDLLIGFYGNPKNNGRRFLCEGQRRASPKRRDSIIIPMIALSLPDAILDNLSSPFPRRVYLRQVRTVANSPAGFDV
jgi:hypothetical protein